MSVRSISFLTVVVLGLALIPSGSRLMELPGRLDLPRDEYFLIQSLDQGSFMFGLALILGLAGTTLLTWRLRDQRLGFGLGLFAAAHMAAALLVFLIWILPANHVTEDWTSVPADWQSLRLGWEYAHIATAILTFGAFCATALLPVLVPMADRQEREALDRGGKWRDAATR